MGLRLSGWNGAGQPLEAHPSLLLRLEGASQWGAFRYQPVLARQGHHVTREHRLVLALWGRLMAEHQGAPVDQGLVLGGAGAGRPEKVNLAGSLGSQLDQSLTRLAADLERQGPPPLVSDRKKCTLCSWRDLCDGEARQQGHLSEVSGIGGKRRELLLEAGIGSLADLAAADPQHLADALAAHGEQHREMAPQLVAQALVQQGGQARRLHQGTGLPAPALPEPALPELARAPGVLLYDIESDPDARDDFLHGLVRLRRQGGAAGPGGEAPDPWPASAAAAPIFEELERTTDVARERELEVKLQELFVEEAPAIPLFPNPSWGEFSTRRFEGFPSEANPWAALSPNKMPDALLVLTEIRPRVEVKP